MLINTIRCDMPGLSTPQQQAGILSFYDAPEKGPRFSAKHILVFAVIFSIIIIFLDHVVAL
jgi:preprotein translocase subunit Sec61beta